MKWKEKLFGKSPILVVEFFFLTVYTDGTCKMFLYDYLRYDKNKLVETT